MSYKPKHGSKKEYKSIIDTEGNLTLLDETFSSPSCACIKDADSPRKTVNDWTPWKTMDGRTIAILQDTYKKHEKKNKRTNVSSRPQAARFSR